MNKPRRSLALLLLACLCVTCLTGCHGSRGSKQFIIPEEFDESREYTITFWAKNDTNKTQSQIYEQAIEDFHALYPNIMVNLRLYTDYSRIYNDVITNIATQTTPNVCITYPDHIATYLTGTNSVVALDGLFADEKYGFGGSALRYDAPTQEEIIPQFLAECVCSDQHYAIPYMRSTEACYVNKTYVEKLCYTLPDVLTWDFIWEVSEAAVKQDANGIYLLNGKQVMIPFIYKSTDNMMIQYLQQSASGYSDAQGGIYLYNETTRSLLNTVAAHAATGAFSTFKISGYPANFLNAGQCVFAVDSTAGATWMGAQAPLSDISEEQIVKFETAVLPVPQVDPAHPQMISQGPSICIFNKTDAQEVLASWLFAQYLLTNDVQIAYAQTEGYVPVTAKAQQSDTYRDYLSRAGEDSAHYEVKIQAAQLLLDNTQNTFVTPVFNGSASLRNAAGALIENVTKSVRRGQTIDDAYYTTMYADTTALYHLGEGVTAMTNAAAEPLPTTAIVLLASLGCAWIGMAAYAIGRFAQKKRSSSRKD